MKRKKRNSRAKHGLQAITLCISTAMVLVLLGLVVFSVLLGRNLSSYVKENLSVTMLLEQDMTTAEARQLCVKLQGRPYLKQLRYVSKEQALQALQKELGADPTEFADANPCLSSIELSLASEYANNDSLKWISKELKQTPKVSEVNYQRDLIDDVNRSLAKLSLVLLVLALLLTAVSFSLINNSVRLGIYARRFSIHTMKLVGASWSFIRRPFVRRAIVMGLIAAVIACAVLAALIYALQYYEPGVNDVLNWQTYAITAASIFVFGILITAVCAGVSVNKFLRMKASDLYKI